LTLLTAVCEILPCDMMHISYCEEVNDAVTGMTRCLFVRLSLTCRCRVKTAKHLVQILSRLCSSVYLFFSDPQVTLTPSVKCRYGI